MKKFYVTSHTYIGPDSGSEQHVDSSSIKIRTRQTEAGNFAVWAIRTHGTYSTLKRARAAVSEIFGDVRETYEDPDDDHFIESFKPGLLEPLSHTATFDMCGDDALSLVDADTTEEVIDTLIEQYQEKANQAGCYLNEIYLRMVIEDHQMELQQDQEESKSSATTDTAVST